MGISTDSKFDYLEPFRETSVRKIYLADYLGSIPYKRALKLQRRLVQARGERSIPDVVMMLQHPPVLTIGRFRGEDDIIVPREVLAQQGIAVVHTNRGGSTTYHGPGQLVGYPILNLKELCLGVREYIAKLEEVIIRLLLDMGIRGHRVAGFPGSVWVGDEKICSIGVHVSHYIAMHGFALNVNTDLRHFEYINPCGIRGKVMTSISKLLGYSIDVEAIAGVLLDSFSETFELTQEQGLKRCLAMLDARNG
ncbi:lipoyl(octanoyl) transferase LipB [Chloroflexota bacterium]